MPLHRIANRTLARFSQLAPICIGVLTVFVIVTRLLLPFAVKVYENSLLSG